MDPCYSTNMGTINNNNFENNKDIGKQEISYFFRVIIRHLRGEKADIGYPVLANIRTGCFDNENT